MNILDHKDVKKLVNEICSEDFIRA
jgi:hypothetical protein